MLDVDKIVILMFNSLNSSEPDHNYFWYTTKKYDQNISLDGDI